jgi:hypothetical protein
MSTATHDSFLSINQNAPAKSRHEIFIHSTPDTVWSILTDIENWKAWNPAVMRSKLNGALAPGTVFEWKSNGFSVRSSLKDIQPARRVSWTGQAFGTRAIHVWYFLPEHGGVRVITEESFEGWLVRLMPEAMQKSLDGSLIAMLANLKRVAETVPSKAGANKETQK